MGVALKLLLDTPSVWTGHSKNQTTVPSSQEVRNSLSDRWIVLKCLQEFMEVVFLGGALKLILDTKPSGRARPRTTQECRLKRYVTPDPTVGSCSNFYRSFNRLVSLASL